MGWPKWIAVAANEKGNQHLDQVGWMGGWQIPEKVGSLRSLNRSFTFQR